MDPVNQTPPVVSVPSKGLGDFLGKSKKNTFMLVGSLLMVLLVVGGIGVATRLYTRASQSPEPQKVKVSNVSENSFTVSFTTDKDAQTFIAFGTSTELGNTAQGKEESLHHIQVKGLKPQTTYYYKIGSGSKQYGQGEQPYTVTTAPIATVPPTPDEMFGKVVGAEGPVAGALVYATVRDADSEGTSGSSNLLSAQTTTAGTFALDLGNARTSSLASRFVYSREADEVKIEVEGGVGGTALVTIKTSQTQPLEDIKVSPVGGAVDLRTQAPTAKQQESQETRTKESTAPAEVEELLAPAVTQEEVKAAKPTISLPTGKVLDPGDTIKGTAAPNTTITITIKSHQPTTVQVATDASGNWSYTLPANFESGGHTITIADASGATATDTFTVTGTEEIVATPAAEPEELPVSGVGWPTVMSLFAGLLLLGLGIVTFKPAKNFS